MIRYRLDDLGWYQFEWLIQSLLKLECGLLVEAWGTSGDFGRDAYSKGPLRFPDRKLLSEGPFIFQVKFIQDANSAGAKPEASLIVAVNKEIQTIKKRFADKKWEIPNYYVLITNAPLSSKTRKKLELLFNNENIAQKNVFLGGNDVSDLLDAHEKIRRSFPQLLGLRDLNELLRKVVDKDVIERSYSAVEIAKDVVKVFVPTTAYNRSWQILREHNFVVLEGPPEVGKTAIGWMIGLSLLSQGWHCLVCDSPSDFFRQYDAEANQVFIADDAFGRTEYDPASGREWEKMFDKVAIKLNSSHWLVWTSRKHIFERAMKVLDLKGESSKLPKSSSVMIDATKLSVEEKALILYRHAKFAKLDENKKEILKDQAVNIVGNPSLTPERIRRLVFETLPNLVQDNLKRDKLNVEILQAIQKPTERMKKSLRALSQQHKLLFLVLLDSKTSEIEKIKNLYLEKITFTNSSVYDFDDLLDELQDSFVKILNFSKNIPGSKYITWIHPSYRDLVIQELVSSPSMREIFIKSASVGGIKLAVSNAGGEAGERKFPFLETARDWILFQERVQQLAKDLPYYDQIELLTSLSAAFYDEMSKDVVRKLSKIISLVCESVRQSWGEKEVIFHSEGLRQYYNASLYAEPLALSPDLTGSWFHVTNNAIQEIDEFDEKSSVHSFSLWLDFVDVVMENEPRFLRKVKFPFSYTESISKFVESIQSYLDWELLAPTENEAVDEIERLEDMKECLTRLFSFAHLRKEALKEIVSKIDMVIEGLREEIAFNVSEDIEAEVEIIDVKNFDIKEIFDDL